MIVATQTNGGNCRNDLAKLQLVQDSSLASCIEANHENPHLPLGKQPLKHTLKVAHGDLKTFETCGTSRSKRPLWC
jgi:hypothetical protein